MSLRINVVMGYGLTDIQCHNGRIIDDRIHALGWLQAAETDRDDRYTMREFREYVREEMFKPKKFGVDHDRADKSIFLNYCKEPLRIHDCIKYDNECGSENVLVLVPPTVHDKWVRHDDALDYYLAASEIYPSKSEPWIQLSNTNFYPYSGFVDSKNGERIQNPYPDMVRDLFINSTDDYKDLSHTWIKDLGCKNVAEVKARYSHAIPGTLKSLIQYTNLFSSPDVMFQLKPLIYCYWS